jgi:DNA primase
MTLTKREPREPRPEPKLIPQETIDLVVDRADIVKVVGQSVQLKKAGANYLGLCPFHGEKSPSFTVTPTKGFYKCFGCGAAGNALTFLMEHDGLPFLDALKQLAGDAGVLLPADDPNAPKGPPVNTGAIYEAMGRALVVFNRALRASDEAKHYLKTQRGITGEIALRFKIGFAPPGWHALADAFDDYATNSAILDSGLIREKVNDSGKRNRWDYFRNRIMFPVRDTRGRVVAFGGRAMPLDDAAQKAAAEAALEGRETSVEPKYMNSPETPVFVKGHTLYGLFEARQAIREKKFVIVCEGYMDVVALAQAGFENAVAGMGTSFTRQQFERLIALTDHVVFSFDNDSAGHKAAWRALEMVAPLLEDKLTVRFLIIPDGKGKDPDELIREQGAQAYQALIEGAPQFSEFLLSTLKAKHNALKGAEDRARFASEGSSIAARLPQQGRLRRILQQLIAQEAGIASNTLRSAKSTSLFLANPATTQKPLWTRLLEAVQRAPDAAAEHRAAILEVLDAEADDEAELYSALWNLQASSTDGGALVHDDDWMRARDLIAGAVSTICDKRREQALLDLKRQHEGGQLSDAEYAVQSLRLATG